MLQVQAAQSSCGDLLLGEPSGEQHRSFGQSLPSPRLQCLRTGQVVNVALFEPPGRVLLLFLGIWRGLRLSALMGNFVNGQI